MNTVFYLLQKNEREVGGRNAKIPIYCAICLFFQARPDVQAKGCAVFIAKTIGQEELADKGARKSGVSENVFAFVVSRFSNSRYNLIFRRPKWASS